VKAINDHPEHGGHEIADAVTRKFAKALAEEKPTSFFVRGKLVTYVEPGESKGLIERLNAKVGDTDFKLIGSEGDSLPAAADATNAAKDEARAKGAYPERATLSDSVAKRLPGLQEEMPKQEDNAVLAAHPELLQAKKGDREFFHSAYVDKQTGTLLNARGWHEIPRKANVAALDVRGLDAANKRFGHAGGDELLHSFGKRLDEFGASHFDAAHKSGDEYALQHDDPQQLQSFIDGLSKYLEEHPVALRDPATGKNVELIVEFRYGTGPHELAADRDLNQKRAREKAGASSDPGAIPEGGGAHGDSMGGGGPAWTKPLQPIAQGYPEEVDTLHQAANQQPNLLVQHNLSEEGLHHASELGGLAAPSIAVSRVEHPLHGFGDISLLGHKELVDPKTGTPVFSADVYSPRHPRASFRVEPKAARAIVKELAPFAKETGAYLSDIEGEIERRGAAGAIQERSIRPALELAYLREKGVEVEKPIRDAQLSHHLSDMPALRTFFKERGKEQNFSVDSEYHQQLSEAVRKAATEYEEQTKEPGIAKDLLEELTGEDGKVFFGRADAFLRDADRVGTKELDKYAYQDALEAKVKELGKEDFEAWALQKLKPAEGAPFIKKMSDNGNTRRIPYNLESVLREVTRKIRQGEDFNYGLGTARAAGAKKFRSIEDIQKARDQITSHDYFQSRKDKLDASFGSLADELRQYGGGGMMHTLDNLAEAIGESYKRGKSLRRELEASTFKDVPEELFQKVADFRADLLAMPTEYFEAKPQRAVKLQEFHAAVVPDTASPRTHEILKKHGLDVFTYKKGDSFSRSDTIAQAASSSNLLFQDGNGTFTLEKKGERGYITFGPSDGGKPRRFDIHLLENADPSTFAHETMHLLSEVLGDVAQRPDAPADLKADYQTLLDFMGHASHEERVANNKERRTLGQKETRTPEEEARLTALTAKEERVSHAWEQYLAEGKSPSVELAGVFTRFKNWMTKIYRGIQGIQTQFRQAFGEDIGLSDHVRGVFDRLLASEDEVKKAQEANQAAQPFTPALEKMTPAERAEYDKVTGEAQAAAEGDMLRRIVEGQRKENTAFMKGERERIGGEVAAELDQNPTYRALRFLQDGDTGESPGETPPWLKGEGGEPLKLDRKALVKKYGPDFVRELPRGMFAKKGGTSAEDMATLLGWDSGEEMLRALKASTPRKETLRAEVQRRMEAQYGPALLDNAEQLASMAVEAVHSPAAAKKAVLELNALRRALMGAGTNDAVPGDAAAYQKLRTINAEDAAQRNASEIARNQDAQRKARLDSQLRSELLRPFDMEAAKAHAKSLVRAKSVGEIVAGDYGLAGQYERAERQAAKGSLEAAAKGDYVSAIALKERQLFNNALFREARDVRAQMEKAFDKLQGSGKAAWRSTLGKADPAYRDAHDAILQAVGLQEAAPGQNAVSIDGFIAKAQADASDIDFDVNAIRDLLARPLPIPKARPAWKLLPTPEGGRPSGTPEAWKRLSVDEAQNVADAVTNIRHLANATAEFQLGERRVSREALFKEMSDTISKRKPQPLRPRDATAEGKLHDARRVLQSIDANLLTMESLVSMADGEDKDGPFRRALIAPEVEARDSKRKLMQEYTSRIVEAWQKLPEELRSRKTEKLDLSVDLPLDAELKRKMADGPVSRPQLWMLMLNMGNEGNKQRLLDGYGWTEEQVRRTIDKHATKAEWDFVQTVWDTLESMYPKIAANHEKLTGLPLPRVEATPIQTPFGEYRGGYFPAREEPRAKTGPVRQNPEMVADMFGESYRRPTVASGHTKARTEKADYYINLDWSVVPSHISQVVHDIAYRPAVRQMASILLDPQFRDMTEGFLGEERAKQFVPWLQAVANAQADGAPAHVAGANRLLGLVRNRAAQAALGANLGSMAAHLVDPLIPAATGHVGKADTAVAYAKAVTPAFFGMRRFALENSNELQARSDHLTRELTRELQEVGKPEGRLLRRARETVGIFHELMDKYVTTTTWTAGYTGAMREGLKSGLPQAEAHGEAVKAANDLIRKTFPSTEVSQQSAAIRRKDFLGTALMFQGFANKVYNLQRQAVDEALTSVHHENGSLGSKAGAVARIGGSLLALGMVGATGRLLRGSGKEDDETGGEWFARTLLSEPFSTVPILAPVTEWASNLAVTGHKKQLNLRSSPVAGLAEEMAGRILKAAHSEDATEEEKLQQYIETIFMFGLASAGSAQIHKTADYVRQLSSGEADPRGPLDVAGGLIYGKREKQGQNPFTAAQDVLSE
jgi:GGDEF domain-containing protein